MTRTFTHDQARRFYDRVGAAQDTQAPYEAPALDLLIRHGAFATATAVVEFGAGTGRFATELLAHHLPPTSSYRALDVSPRMVGLATERLARFGSRAQVLQTDGSIELPLPDRSADRLVTTYVLDLLSESDIQALLVEAHRVLVPGGLLGIASLTRAYSPGARVLQGLWMALYRIRPALVGGCRPITLDPWLQSRSWEISFSGRVVRFGMPSQVLIARAVSPASDPHSD